MITLYTKPACPHCVAAKHYLTSFNISFQEVDVTDKPEALTFIKSQGHRTVPQIYVGEKLLVEGGNAGLQKLSAEQIRQRADNH